MESLKMIGALLFHVRTFLTESKRISDEGYAQGRLLPHSHSHRLIRADHVMSAESMKFSSFVITGNFGVVGPHSGRGNAQDLHSVSSAADGPGEEKVGTIAKRCLQQMPTI
jgi:hypothetical protein